MSFPHYNDLIRHYEDTSNALSFYFDSIIAEIKTDSNYSYLTQQEIETVLYNRLYEVEIQTCLMILASIEGMLRINYGKNYPNIDISKLSIAKIINYWLDSLIEQEKIKIQNFKIALEFRNWIAHDRHVPYPVRQEYHKLDFLYNLAKDIENILNIDATKIQTLVVKL